MQTNVHNGVAAIEFYLVNILNQYFQVIMLELLCLMYETSVFLTRICNGGTMVNNVAAHSFTRKRFLIPHTHISNNACVCVCVCVCVCACVRV